jgi:cytochrome c-type biogenesis protein CcmH
MKLLLPLVIVLVAMAPAHAAIEAYQFRDAQTEELYKDLIKELRCLVCQNQNLADSDADLAKDLRQQTYEMLQQGKDREQIIEFMVSRYGDFVLYRPPVKKSTFLLWAGPFALLVIVLVFVVLRVRNARTADTPEAEAVQRAHDLLSGSEKKGDES